MSQALVTVTTTQGGYAATCSVHGPCSWWSHPFAATWDAIGHAAHHHQRTP